MIGCASFLTNGCKLSTAYRHITFFDYTVFSQFLKVYPFELDWTS